MLDKCICGRTPYEEFCGYTYYACNCGRRTRKYLKPFDAMEAFYRGEVYIEKGDVYAQKEERFAA